MVRADLGRGRLAWVDTAKSIAIVLIVVYHVSGVAATELTADRGPAGQLWWGVSQALLPVRIPLFFLLAGYLGRRALARPLRATVRTKVADLAWTFAVWSLLFALVAGPWVRPDAPLEGTLSLSWTILTGGTAYWFLYALPLYFLATRHLIARPVAALVIAAALFVASPWLTTVTAAALDPQIATSVRRLTGFWLFYAAGAVAGSLIDRIAALPWWFAGVATAGFAVVFLATRQFGASLASTLVLSVLGIVAIIVLSRVLARNAAVARVSETVARATLPIYVTHSLLLHASYRVADETGRSLPPGTAVDLGFVPVTTLALVVLGVVAGRIVSRFDVRGIFDAPARPAAARRSADQ